MALVASLDLTAYLQAVSTPSWIGNSCAMAHSHSSASLLRTAPPVVGLTPSTSCHVLPQLDDVKDCSFRSRDSGATTSDSTAADSGFSSDSSEETKSESSSSSTSSSSASWPRSNRKRVSFADDVGLDLVTVRRYDLPGPTPPPVADPVPAAQRPAFRRRLRLEPGFRQPWLDPAGLRSRLDVDAVAVESASGRGAGLSFAGTVLVADVAFEKRVTVRCTFDFWRTFVDVEAVYVTSGCPGTDLFAFEVHPDAATVADQSSPRRGRGRFEFAVRYQYRAHSDAAWMERWDNNRGRNYQMLATW